MRCRGPGESYSVPGGTSLLNFDTGQVPSCELLQRARGQAVSVRVEEHDKDQNLTHSYREHLLMLFARCESIISIGSWQRHR